MPTKVANGNIPPSRFVKQDTTAEHKVLVCGAGDPIFGVSHEGQRNPPITGFQDGYAAIAGENIRIYGVGEECWVESGGTFTAGANLKASTLGVAVATTTNLDEVGAIAIDASTASGQLVRVQVLPRRQVSAA